MATQLFGFTETLKDGSRVTIRPLNMGDISAEREFILRLSPESRRYRFLSTIASPSEAMLKQLTNLNESTEAAFVAFTKESGVQREVGVARLSAIGDGRAEFAVTVRDDWQHKGLGRRLTEYIIEEARRRGLRGLFSVDSSENRPMQLFARALGFRRDVNPKDATEVMHTLQLN
jgi:GNAT superfamily N-acetyltransferase